MGDELKKQLAVEVEYQAGSNGIFEISLDGTLIFSKSEARRFPEPLEIVNLIKSH